MPKIAEEVSMTEMSVCTRISFPVQDVPVAFQAIPMGTLTSSMAALLVHNVSDTLMPPRSLNHVRLSLVQVCSYLDSLPISFFMPFPFALRVQFRCHLFRKVCLAAIPAGVPL